MRYPRPAVVGRFFKPSRPDYQSGPRVFHFCPLAYGGPTVQLVPRRWQPCGSWRRPAAWARRTPPWHKETATMDHEHIHFVTGRLAEHALRELLPSLAAEVGFDYSVGVMPITVAALMTPAWIARHVRRRPRRRGCCCPATAPATWSRSAASWVCPSNSGPRTSASCRSSLAAAAGAGRYGALRHRDRGRDQSCAPPPAGRDPGHGPAAGGRRRGRDRRRLRARRAVVGRGRVRAGAARRRAAGLDRQLESGGDRAGRAGRSRVGPVGELRPIARRPATGAAKWWRSRTSSRRWAGWTKPSSG